MCWARPSVRALDWQEMKGGRHVVWFGEGGPHAWICLDGLHDHMYCYRPYCIVAGNAYSATVLGSRPACLAMACTEVARGERAARESFSIGVSIAPHGARMKVGLHDA